MNAQVVPPPDAASPAPCIVEVSCYAKVTFGGAQHLLVFGQAFGQDEADALAGSNRYMPIGEGVGARFGAWKVDWITGQVVIFAPERVGQRRWHWVLDKAGALVELEDLE